MPDATAVAAWIGVLVAVGGAIAGFIKFLFYLMDELRRRSAAGSFRVPKRSLHLAMKMPSNYWWHMGKIGEDPTMQVVGSVFASNIASVPVRSPQVILHYGFLGHRKVFGMVLTASGGPRNVYGMNDIPPGETRDLSFDFWLFPPVAQEGKAFVAHSVTVMDQFGNRHVLKRVAFTPH